MVSGYYILHTILGILFILAGIFSLIFGPKNYNMIWGFIMIIFGLLWLPFLAQYLGGGFLPGKAPVVVTTDSPNVVVINKDEEAPQLSQLESAQNS